VRIVRFGAIAMTAAMTMAAALVAARLTMWLAAAAAIVTVGTARFFLLTALLFGQLRQVVRHHFNLHANNAFNVPQIGALGRIAEADRDAFGAGAGGTADTVHIAFRFVGQL